MPLNVLNLINAELIAVLNDLPRQLALAEINEHISETDQVVSSSQLQAVVTVDASVSLRAHQPFLLHLLDVSVGEVKETLSQAEVDHVDGREVVHIYHEVLWFYVSMHEGCLVQIAKAPDGL